MGRVFTVYMDISFFLFLNSWDLIVLTGLMRKWWIVSYTDTYLNRENVEGHILRVPE